MSEGIDILFESEQLGDFDKRSIHLTKYGLPEIVIIARHEQEKTRERILDFCEDAICKELTEKGKQVWVM